MKWKEHLSSLKAYQPGRTIDEVKKQYGLETITKLASNENPYGYSSKVIDVLENQLGHFELYPDGAAVELKAALALSLIHI